MHVALSHSRHKPMGLIVAQGEAPAYEARGSLFWDDGETYGMHIQMKKQRAFLFWSRQCYVRQSCSCVQLRMKKLCHCRKIIQ